VLRRQKIKKFLNRKQFKIRVALKFWNYFKLFLHSALVKMKLVVTKLPNFVDSVPCNVVWLFLFKEATLFVAHSIRL
jgi:hypothetical protein